MKHQVLLFYTYQTIENPKGLAEWFRAAAERYNLLGRVIIAEEGVNAILEGLIQDTEQFVQAFYRDPRFTQVQIKRSLSDGMSLPKLSVKVRDEIVGTHFPREIADPRVKTAPHLAPEELRAWYETKEDFVVIDMRNDYEYASGHFKDSIDPGLRVSRDLPAALPKLVSLKDKKIVTVCTGGVRCEKMSAYLLNNGFNEVYQLDGGIHSYMEKYPGKDFEGTLYTFDNRLTMDFGGNREVVGICYLCSNKTERYVNCAYDGCHLHFLICDVCAAGKEEVYCSGVCASFSAVH